MVTIKVSIADFAQPNEKLGDIDSESNFSLSSLSMELGQRIHQHLQGQRKKQFESYIAEQSISHKFNLNETLILDVSGRMDGIWKDPSSGEIVIEEIKSTFKTAPLLKELQSKPEHPYIMQLKIYGWIYYIQHNVAPKLRLTVVSTSGRETNELSIEFEPTTFEEWLNKRLIWYRLTWIKQQDFLTARAQLSSKIKFPFAKKRPGQDQLVDLVSQKCKKGGELLVEAATGLGKTAGVLTPAIKIGILSGRKIFHVTPKNSQLQEAESVIKKIQRRKASIQGLMVTAKSKICMMPEVNCNPNYCKFAKLHFTKVSQLGLIEKALEFPVIKAKHLQQLAKDFEVCPYELSKQVMPWVDVIAGDYQYALSPHETFLNASKFPIDMGIKPILSIDEAHNLAERSFEWYQMSLMPFPIQAINSNQKKLVKDCRELNSWLLETRRKNPMFEDNSSKLRVKDQGSSTNPNHFDKSRAEVIRNFNIEVPKKILEKFSLHIPAYLESLDRPGGSNAEIDPLILIWFEWLQFVHLYEEKPWLFFGLTTTNTDDIAILCANAGPFTSQILANYHAKIAYSATLKPFSYHQLLCGFDQETMQTVEFSSPFPKERRKVIVIPQISTKYKDRRSQIPRIADVIQRITAQKIGNYFVFFPSFELLRQTESYLDSASFAKTIQPPRAALSWIKDVRQMLEHSNNNLILAVQGGALSEGIDLPGDQIIGAFIVGPAIPMISRERDERARIISEQGYQVSQSPTKGGSSLSQLGYAVSYIFPGMSKSIQSAGRVIRTATDKGIIVLMDSRFLEKPYTDAFPSDWLGQGDLPSSLVSTQILKDIADFWAMGHET